MTEHVSCTVCAGGGPRPANDTKETRAREVEQVGVLLVTLIVTGMVRILEPLLSPPETNTFARCFPGLNPFGIAEIVKVVGDVPEEPVVGITFT